MGEASLSRSLFLSPAATQEVHDHEVTGTCHISGLHSTRLVPTGRQRSFHGFLFVSLLLSVLFLLCELQHDQLVTISLFSYSKAVTFYMELIEIRNTLKSKHNSGNIVSSTSP